MVSVPIENIVEHGIDEKRFITRQWTDAIRTAPIRFEVKGAVLELLPALKIEAGIPPNKVRFSHCSTSRAARLPIYIRVIHPQVTQAFDALEDLFTKACKRHEDPEKAYLRIIKSYTYRITRSSEFVPLEESGNKPKHR